MAATRETHCNRTGTTGNGRPVLFLAFELGWSEWKLAFTIGPAQKPRLRTIVARDLAALEREIAAAKRRFGLPADARLVSGYEAGRDGFWLDRYLRSQGIENIVVDSASIEVNRRGRRAKTDRLDATKLVLMLIRWFGGEPKLWSVLRVPSDDDEDGRQLHRELEELKDERTSHTNRIKGLLAGQGLCVQVGDDLLGQLDGLRRWDGTAVPAALRARLVREFQRRQLLERQIMDLENERNRRLRRDDEPQVSMMRHLLNLRGIGTNGSWLLTREFFGWRDIRNRRELASLAGLVPTPYSSGGSEREQGISKAGNRRLRRMMVELAWCWLRYQPASELSRWYLRRFGSGNARQRKIGIVALARKLLVALWRYADQGEVPAGAEFSSWHLKVTGRIPKRARVAAASAAG